MAGQRMGRYPREVSLMGMDVFGTTRGVYNVNHRGWRMVWWLTHEVEPELCDLVRSPFLNDGDGLDAEPARRLANAMQAAWDDGRIDRLIEECNTLIAGLPGEPGERVEREHVRPWIEFLRECGGFEIW